MTEAGLGWALTLGDALISQGVAEEWYVNEQIASAGYISDVQLTEVLDEPRRGKGFPAITSRPQTVRERVLTLLDTLRRVTIDLPAVERDTLKRLFDPSGEKQTWAHGIQFLPDEGMQDPRLRLGSSDSTGDPERGVALSQVISDLREEVLS